MNSFADVIKILLDDFVRMRWGDLVALLLIFSGICLVLLAVGHFQGNTAIEKLGSSLVAAGLFALRPITMKSGSANGNGPSPPPKP